MSRCTAARSTGLWARTCTSTAFYVGVLGGSWAGRRREGGRAGIPRIPGMDVIDVQNGEFHRLCCGEASRKQHCGEHRVFEHGQWGVSGWGSLQAKCKRVPEEDEENAALG